MIRSTNSRQVQCPTNSEAAIRIRSLAKAYGDDDSVVQFYSDDNGTVMSVMDGVAALHAPHGVDEEWLHFLTFVPDVQILRTDGATGAAVSEVWSSPMKQGVLMQYTSDRPEAGDTLSQVRLDDLYALLRENFPSMPPFDIWYVDVSHRVRHGHCHIACICRENKPVSSAMTVAEADDAVLLGAVATDRHWRRQGLAGRCVLTLVDQFYGRRLYIAPVNGTAAALYEKLGFTPCHTWAEIAR